MKLQIQIDSVFLCVGAVGIAMSCQGCQEEVNPQVGHTFPGADEGV